MHKTALAILATSAVLVTSAPRSSISSLDVQALFQRLPLSPKTESRRKQKVSRNRRFSEEVVKNTAQLAADKMMEVVKKIQTEADQLLQIAQESKTKFLGEINSMAVTDSDMPIPEFAASVNNLVHRVDAQWKAFGAVANESANTIASAFSAEGQDKLGSALVPGVDSAVQYIGKFLEKLDSANLDIQDSANSFAASQTVSLLKRVDEKLTDGLKHVSQFILQFRAAFIELFDSLSSAVCWNSADAKEAFKPVRHHVVSIVWRFRSAGQDAIFPIPMGLVRIAEKAGMPPPIWHPVEIQVQPPRSKQ